MSQQSPPEIEPVGAGNYVVRQGDCLGSIAYDHGFFWKTLWNHPDNADLKRVRKYPNILFEGDQVSIPEIQTKAVSAGCDQRHRFRVKGVPAKLKLHMVVGDKPLANQPYKLTIDSRTLTGQTDGEGNIECAIPPNAHEGHLVVGRGADAIERVLKLGHVDPIDSISGMQGRLNNLGYHCGAPDGKLNDATRQAIREFQTKMGLESTGEADQATRDKLAEEFRA